MGTQNTFLACAPPTSRTLPVTVVIDEPIWKTQTALVLPPPSSVTGAGPLMSTVLPDV